MESDPVPEIGVILEFPNLGCNIWGVPIIWNIVLWGYFGVPNLRKLPYRSYIEIMENRK